MLSLGFRPTEQSDFHLNVSTHSSSTTPEKVFLENRNERSMCCNSYLVFKQSPVWIDTVWKSPVSFLSQFNFLWNMNIYDHQTTRLSPFCKSGNYKTVSQWKGASVISIPVTPRGPGKGSQAVRHWILTQKIPFTEIMAKAKQDIMCELKQPTIKEKGSTKVTVITPVICMEKLVFQNGFRDV